MIAVDAQLGMHDALQDLNGSRAQCIPSGLRALAAIVVSAVLIGLAAPGIGGYPWLTWIAFAPWLASLKRLSPWAAVLSGLLMGMAYIVPGRWDTFHAGVTAAGFHGAAGNAYTVLFFLSFALPFALFGGLDRRFQRAFHHSPSFVPLARAALLASLICGVWSPFPYTPASMLVDFAAILQVAAIGGEPLLLCLLLWPSAALGSLHGRARLRQIGAAFLPPALCLAALVGYGAWRIQALDQAEVAGAGVSLTALPLQLDLPRHAAPSLLTRDHAKGRASALELSRDGMQQAPACELVVWPETPLDPVRQQQVCAEGQRMADRLGRPLLMQCMRDHETQRQVTAELLRPGQLSAPVFHAKSSLVPIYEQPLWGKGDLVAGPPGGVFAFDQARLIPAICYELHSRTHLRAGVLAGGNAVVHMASFAAFGPLIDVWDLGLARMRAVEFGVPIIRATNRGSVGWIDAAGRARSLSTGFGPHAQCVSVWSPAGTPTLHTQLAPIAAWLPALLVLLLGRAGGDVRPSHRSSHQPPGVNHESAT